MTWPDTVLFSDSFTTLAAYYGLGVVVYYALEHWNIEDSIYFLTQAAFTVGFGDTVPHSMASRLFTAVYAPLGTFVLGHNALAQGRALLVSLSGASTEPASATSTSSYQKVLELLPGLLVVIAGGAAAVIYLQGLAYDEAAYYAASTATTQGYGDYGPHGRLQMILTIPYMWMACGAFFALLEQGYLIARAKVVQTTRLAKVVDQLLLQPSPWDTTVGGAPKAHAAKAELGEGLSEAEFLLAVLIGHGVVDAPTLVALRRQYAHLMRTARAHDPRTAGAGAGAPAAADGSSESPAVCERLDAHAVFAIGLSEHTIQQRPAEEPVGSSVEAAVHGDGVRVTPTALIDLRAPDGGFGEWHEHFWLKRLAEIRKAAGADDAPSSEPPVANGGAHALV